MAKRRRRIWIVVGLLVLALAGGGAWLYNRFNSGAKLLSRARVAIAADKLQKAEALALEYVRQAPDDWHGHYTLATAYQRQGKHELARTSLAVAARINPGNVDVILALADTYSHPGAAVMARLEASDPNDIRIAIAGLVKAEEVLSKFTPAPNDQAGLLKLQESRGMGLLVMTHARSTLAKKMTAPANAADPVRALFETEACRAERKTMQAQAEEARGQAIKLLLDVVRKDPSRDVPAEALVGLCIESKDKASLELARKAIESAKKPAPTAALRLAQYDLNDANDAAGTGRQARLGPVIRRVQAILDANPENKTARCTRAELALMAGDPATAERLAQEILKSQANDSSARLLYARALLDSGDPIREAQAETELYTLKTTFGNWPAAQYWYALAADTAGKPELAREAMRVVTQLERDPAGQQANPQLFRGARQYLAAQLVKDFPAQAFEEARACYESDPNDLPGLDLYVQAAIGSGQPGLARQALDQARKKRPGEPQVLDLVRKGLLALGDRARATEVAQQAAGIKPAGILQLVAVTNALDFLGRGAEADRLVSQAAENDPNNPEAQLALAARYAVTGRQYQAVDQCRRALALDPNTPNYRLALAGALINTRELDEARAVLEPILATNSKARDLETQVRILQGKPIGDEDVLGAGGRGRSGLAMAYSCVTGGQTERGIGMCKAELERNPAAPVGWRLLLGQAYLAQGKTDECIRAWSEGIAAHPESHELYLSIALLIGGQVGPEEVGRRLSAIAGAQQGLVDLAVASANAGQKQFAAAADLYAKVASNTSVADAVRYQASIERAKALALDNKADEAVGELDKLIKAGVQPGKTTITKIGLLAALGRTGEAETFLTDMLKTAETNRDVRLAVGAAESLLQLRKFDKALAACDLVQRLLPNEPGSYILRARVFQQAGRGVEVADLYRKAIALQPTRLEYYAALAESLDAQNEPQQALDALRKMESLGQPGKLASRLQQGDLLTRWGLTKEAAQCLDPLAESVNTPRDQLFLASRLAAAGRKDKAISLLVMVPRDAPEHLRALLMLANLAETPQKKLACLEAVNAQAANSDYVLSRKMAALMDGNRPADALKAFAQAVAANQNNPQPLPASTDLALKAALKQGDLAGARLVATILAAMSRAPSWRAVVDEINLELDPDMAARQLPAPEKATMVQATMGLCLARQAGDAQALKAWADRLDQLARGEPDTRPTSQPGPAPAPRLPGNLRLLCALVVGNEPEIQAAAAAVATGSVAAQAASELRQFVAKGSDANKTTRQLLDLLKAELALIIQRPEFASFWAGRALEARPQCQWAAMQMQLASGLAAAFAAPLEPQRLKRAADLLEPRDCPLAQELQADACMYAGQFDQAVKLYAALAEADKDNSTWIRLQAAALERAGDPESASQHAENIKKAVGLYRQAWLRTKAPSTCNNWAYLVCEVYPQDKAMLAEAQKAMDELASRQALHSSFRDTIGWIAFHQGRTDDACRLLRQSVKDQPGSVEVHYHLGLAESAGGNKPLARMHLKQAVAIGQELRNAHKKDPAKIILPAEVQAVAKAKEVLYELFPDQ